jgi:hypothetical protein
MSSGNITRNEIMEAKSASRAPTRSSEFLTRRECFVVDGAVHQIRPFSFTLRFPVITPIRHLRARESLNSLAVFHDSLSEVYC